MNPRHAACFALLAGCDWFSAPPPPCSDLAALGASEEDGRCVIAGLDTGKYAGKRLPDQLTVRGDLTIYGQRIDRLPKGLIVEGNLHLYKAEYDLPSDIVVHGDVDSTVGFGGVLPRCADIPKSAKLLGAVRCE